MTKPRSSHLLMNDLVHAARVAGVEADRAKIAEGIALFSEQFATQPVEIRTTTRELSHREVSFRFVDESARGECWQRTRDWHQIKGDAATFMDACFATFPIRAEGIDADVRLGFRKAWAFLGQGFRIERFAGLPGAPKGLAKAVDVLTRSGMHHQSIIGIDPESRTCNLYPMIRPGSLTREAASEVAQALGLPEMRADWFEGIEGTVAGNFTFSWDVDRVERLAFYRPAMSEADLPNDDLLRGFARGCPVIAPQRAYVASITFAHVGHYRKVEVDYDGGIVPVLIRCAQVPNEAA